MRIRIGTKIFVVLLIFFIEILALMSIFSIINRRHERIMHSQSKATKKLNLIRGFQFSLTQMIVFANDNTVNESNVDRNDNFILLAEETDDIISKLSYVTFRSIEEKELFSIIKENYFLSKDSILKIFSIPKSNTETSVKTDELFKKMYEYSRIALNDTDKLYQLVYQAVKKTESEMHNIKNYFDITVLLGILCNIVLIPSALFYFRRTISLPINSIRNAILEVGRKSFEKKINIKSKDEIGDLAGSFNQMTQELKRHIQQEKKFLTEAEASAKEEKRRKMELEEAYDELKKAQTKLVQTEKMAAVGQLASGVAHEVKNPLGIIIQGINYLEKQISPDKKQQFEVFGMIKEAVTRADRIIRQLLGFSRKSPMKYELYTIDKIFNSSLSLVKKQLSFRNIKINKKFQVELPLVLVDKNQMIQVFINIILNSIQAMSDKGELTIRINTKELKKENYIGSSKKLVICEVEDTGEGISEDNLKKVFDPFFTTKGVGKGTGLGLSVTKNIIEAHMGNIEIESKKGIGAKVIIALPAAKGG